MTNYAARADQLIKAFPERIAEPPALLLAFADWLAARPWGSVGSFDLSPGWSDHVVFGGERFFRDFALVIRLPDGSRAGYWLRDDRPLEQAPIVLLGSEGEAETWAPDLPSFLVRLATADFDDSGPASDLMPSPDDDGPNLRGDLAAWLGARLGASGADRLKRPRPGQPDAFRDWYLTGARAPETDLADDPDTQAITKLLEHYRPPASAASWDVTTLSVGWAGDQVEVVNASAGHGAVPEKDALLPHLAALRRKAAERTPGIGLWHHAWITIANEDPARLDAIYLFEPKFFLGQPPAEAFRADQRSAPRTARRIPDWLAALLA